MATNEREILLRSLQARESAAEEEEGELERLLAPLLAAGEGAAGFSPLPEEDIGISTAFGAGIKEGVLSPLTIFGYRPEELNLDERGEKIANFLGSLVGFGIGFVPFAAGTGTVMRGIGLTKRLSEPVAQFVKFSIAGTAQAAGMAEEVEDVPRSAAIGFAAGVAVDGFFLARAMKARRALADAIDTGSPIGAAIDDADNLAKEIELSPAGTSKPQERIREEVVGLADDGKSLDEILATLGRDRVETVRIPWVEDPGQLFRTAAAAMPDAQILRRRIGGREEMLVHNPVREADRLTPDQISHWQRTGLIENMEVYYGDKRALLTGVEAAPDYVQLKVGKQIFAAPRSDVTFPLAPRIVAKDRMFRRAMQVAAEHMQSIGFAIRARGPGGREAIRRGTVNTEGFERVESLGRYVKDNIEEIRAISAQSIEDATRLHALKNGIRGLIEVDNGITKRVHVFDQRAVQYVKEPPRINEHFNKGLSFRQDPSTGDLLISSFEVDWRNAVIGNLRREGFKEKEIRAFLDDFLSEEANRMYQFVDDEVRSSLQAAEAQFFGGCM